MPSLLQLERWSVTFLCTRSLFPTQGKSSTWEPHIRPATCLFPKGALDLEIRLTRKSNVFPYSSPACIRLELCAFIILWCLSCFLEGSLEDFYPHSLSILYNWGPALLFFPLFFLIYLFNWKDLC